MSDILLSVGDYVIVQDGVIDQPKIVVWDDLTLTEAIAFPADPFLVAVFDSVVAEDPTVPQLLFNFPIMVFDLVRVQEGQSDSDTILPSLFDAVTVTESVSMAMTLLRVNVNDIVTVLESVGIFAQGPLGVLANENITVQEALERYLSLYINAFDNVLVVDGALAPDIFDAVTVAEDITVKLARLLVSGFDTITVTESQEIVGLAYSVAVNEDLIVSESVTLFLAELRLSASSDVTVAEAVTVFVSTIDLTMDVSDSLTVAESIETQTNPVQINEFTQVVLDDVPAIVTGILLISTSDTVTVAESVDVRLLPIPLEVFDDVTLSERIALRVSKAGRKRHDLTVVGAGE